MTTMNVTATGTLAGSAKGIGIQVVALTGANAIQDGAQATGFDYRGGGHNVTAANNNSLVFLTAASKSPAGNPVTAGINTTQLCDVFGTFDWDLVCAYNRVPTVASSSVLVNETSTTSMFGLQKEIRAASGETLAVALTPSAVMSPNLVATTGDFTLLAGAYTLMAMVVAENGNTANLVTIGVSDSKSLTWTKVADSNPTFTSGFFPQTQIWTAPITVTNPFGRSSITGMPSATVEVTSELPGSEVSGTTGR